MDDKDKKKAEIIDLFTAKSRRKPGDSSIAVTGDANVIGDNNTVIHTRKVVRKVVNRVQPGPEHISPAQAHDIQLAVGKLVEIGVKAGDGTERELYARWYSSLKKRFNTNSYLMIPAELGGEALSWLKQQAGLKRPKLRRTDNEAWRKQLYKAIWARSRQVGLSKGEVYNLVLTRLGRRVTSLKPLGERSLKQLYNIVFALQTDSHT